MPFDFPNNPNVGQIIPGSGGAYYRWDGTKWVTAGPPPGTVQSFNSRTGNVLLTQGDVAFALGYTAYDTANPAGYIGDAPNDSNAYVRSANAWANGDSRYMLQSAADARYLRLDGTAAMTGLLTLFGPPTADLNPATKAYADARPYVAATAGQVALTGTTTETNLAALRIPGGSIGPNGAVEVKALWNYTNSANTKTIVTRFNPTAGSVNGGITGGTLPVTTTANAQTLLIMRNNNATNAQVFFGGTGAGPFGAAAAPNATLTLDTTADSYVNINAILANASETITLIHAYLVVLHA